MGRASHRMHASVCHPTGRSRVARQCGGAGGHLQRPARRKEQRGAASRLSACGEAAARCHTDRLQAWLVEGRGRGLHIQDRSERERDQAAAPRAANELARRRRGGTRARLDRRGRRSSARGARRLRGRVAKESASLGAPPPPPPSDLEEECPSSELTDPSHFRNKRFCTSLVDTPLGVRRRA